MPPPFGGCCKNNVGCAMRTMREAQPFVWNGAHGAPYIYPLSLALSRREREISLHGSFTRHIAPEIFVQLDLHPHRQLVLQHPVSQFGGVLFPVAGCE
jgi:hypothetical protein